MKKIKELSTAKKVWLTIVLIPVVIVGAFLFRSHVAYPVAAKIYLANKYSWNYFSIQTCSFSAPPKRYYFDFEGGSHWYDTIPSGYFKYKGRKFYVECMKYSDEKSSYFADEYQLPDIFQWCTEYLQENVSQDIVGVQIYSDIIYHSSCCKFDYKLPWTPKKVFTKEDARTFLEFHQQIHGLNPFYQVDDLNIYGEIIYKDDTWYSANELCNSIKEQHAENFKKIGLGRVGIIFIEEPIFEIGYVGFGYGDQHCMSINIDKTEYAR